MSHIFSKLDNFHQKFKIQQEQSVAKKNQITQTQLVISKAHCPNQVTLEIANKLVIQNDELKQ